MSNKSHRRSISKKQRFEVFKRDSFRCQYCGASGVDSGIILHVDHIKPVSTGGTNNILNLITSCISCNQGKGSILLGDHVELNKQIKLMDALSAKREQSKMMIKWREELTKASEDEINSLRKRWSELAHGYVLNQNGISRLRIFVNRYGFNEVYDSMEISSRYLISDVDGRCRGYSVQFAFDKIGGILFNRSKS